MRLWRKRRPVTSDALDALAESEAGWFAEAHPGPEMSMEPLATGGNDAFPSTEGPPDFLLESHQSFQPATVEDQIRAWRAASGLPTGRDPYGDHHSQPSTSAVAAIRAVAARSQPDW